ncbi:MAG: BlaI/MecI/CopY family transcriptional regulator [Flavisolibacter sp.]|jgi:BlaI family penicillinase repressor
MKVLTKAEEQVMQVLWKLREGFIRDIMDALPSPKPHQNTIATVLKILIEKEFVGVKVFGRQHQYFPIINKEAYSKATMKNLVKGYFGGSFSEAVSFMVRENNISLEDLEILLQQFKKGKK